MSAEQSNETVTLSRAVRIINERTGMKLSESYLYDKNIPTVEVVVRRVRVADLDHIIEQIQGGHL